MKHDDTNEPVSLEGLDPKEALRALLAVDPDAPPVDQDDDPQPDEPSTDDA